MKKTDELYWLAFCVGFDDDNKKILASVLTFWARNRFYALKAVDTMLPEHDNWVRPDGTIHSHELYVLEQCKPSEATAKTMFYVQAFSEVAGISVSPGHNVA